MCQAEGKIARHVAGFEEFHLYFSNLLYKYPISPDRPALLIVALLACLLLAATPAYAATIILGANCSLANAIRSANGDAQVAPANQCAAGDASGLDYIRFVADVEISEALPTIASDVYISGKGFSLSTPDDDSSEGEGTETYDFNLLTYSKGDNYVYELTLSGADDSAIKAEEAENSELNVHISLCDFSDNSAATDGGAINISGGAAVQVFSSTLKGNSAPNGNGGAIYAQNSSLDVNWNQISDNSARDSGGAIYVEVEQGEEYRLILVEGNSFKSNQATNYDGGAIYVENTETTASIASLIEQNSFSDNSARNGGAIFAGGGKLTIENVTIDKNAASEQGGGIYVAGGPVYIRHSTIVENQAANGAGMAIFTDDQDENATPEVNLYNSIVAENSDTDTTNTTCFRDALTANEGNIIQDSNCAAAQAADDDLLLELVDGGPTYSSSKAARYYRLMPGSPAIDKGDNGQGRMLSSDQVGHRRPQGSGYDIGSYEYMVAAPEPERGSPGSEPEEPEASSPGRGRTTKSESAVNLVDTPNTCGPLSERDNGIEVSAAFGLASGVQCQELDAIGIGVQSVIEAGFVKGVDIWGYVSQGVQVCFDAGGPLLFLDAATAPRTVMTIPSFIVDGKTCTYLTRAGSVVLQPAQSGTSSFPVATVQPVASSTTTIPQNCMVTTTDVLNFRDGPNGIRIGLIPQSVTLTVVDKSSSWYKVDWYGAQGWISADYTITRGNC